MNIRRAIRTDYETLVDIWLRSVRATHRFLSEQDIESLIGPTRAYLASDEPEFWVLCGDSDTVVGFMGLNESKLDALFLAPEVQGLGGGRLLVRHAQELRGELTVDVNEQNLAALLFYEACGFVVEGRSDVDDEGRPYPLLHMRLLLPNPPP